MANCGQVSSTESKECVEDQDSSNDDSGLGDSSTVDLDTVGCLQRRSDLVYLRMKSSPAGSTHHIQGGRGRRLSDPGCRLAIHSMRRLSVTKTDDSGTSSVRLSDPRLEVIRSLSPSVGATAAGEEGEALNPVVYRPSRPRSASQHIVHTGGWDNRCRSHTLGGAGGGLAGSSFGMLGVVAAEVGEAMGALARVDRGSPPEMTSAAVPLQSSFTTVPTPLRRRRSVSLECSPLESILEENNFPHGKITRKFSLPANNL